MNDDGTMARLPELIKFAQKHQLKICTIADLIKYRRTREKLVERVEVVKMPTDYGEFDLLSCIAPSSMASIIWRWCAAMWPGRKKCWCGCTANA